MVQRSRFVTTLGHAPDPAAAHALVRAVGEELPDATHHCWAFVAGPPGSTARIGMSDAGEPHGTAGRPMLTALLHGGVGEVVAVCSRWFGGTKLGTGGLARAYAAGVVHALATLPTEHRTPRIDLEVTIAYPYVDALRQILDLLDVRVDAEEYGTDVRYRIAVPEGQVAEFERRLADATAGGGRTSSPSAPGT